MGNEITIEDFKAAIARYGLQYNVQAHVSERLDIQETFKIGKNWPHTAQPGVYGIFDEKKNILYVGKAAHIGHRVGAYFLLDENGNPRTPQKHAWLRPPRYAVVAAVDQIWESSSLEEFLISALNPPENPRGF